MKRNRLLASEFAALLGLLLHAPSVLADCNDTVFTVNTVMADRLGPDYLEAYAAAAYPEWHQAGTEQGWDATRGINDPLDFSEEFGKQMLGSILITQGVSGTAPTVWQNPDTGYFEYNPNQLWTGANFFNSADSYGPLAADHLIQACTFVDKITGAFSCVDPLPKPHQNQSGHWYFGHALVTGVDDAHPTNSGTGAEHHSIWDLFKDPDWEIEYYCRVFEDVEGVAYTARTLVHESWHATNAPGHLDGPQGGCSLGEGRCDNYIFDLQGANRVNAGVARLQGIGVGAYQADQLFACDLVEEPAAWMPEMVRIVANQHAHTRAAQSRFVNIKAVPGDPNNPLGGELPFRCGLPESHLAVLAGTPDPGLCPGSTVCLDNSDCNASNNEFCVEGCCDTIVIK